MSQSQPNILLIFSDQHRHDALGCAGNTTVQTPNIDKLAAQGTRFTNVWCQSPFCQPSRTSFITGLYPHQTGFRDLGSLNNPPTLMKKLQSVGYETATVGKLHYSEIATLKKMAQSESINTADFNAHFKTFGWDYVLQEFDKYIHLDPNITTPYLSFLNEQGLSEQYRELIKNHHRGTPNHWRSRESTIPQEHDLTTYLTNNAIQWLNTRQTNKPFFLKLAYVQPHPPLIDDSIWANYYKDKDIEEPNFARIKSSVPIWNDYIQKLEKHGQINSMPKKNILEGIRHYMGMISLVDQQVGRVIKQLESRNLLDNTIIIYTSDHGEMMGERRLWGKMNFYKSSVNIPLIIRLPKPNQQSTSSGLVELLDLRETILDFARCKNSNGAGESLKSHLTEGKEHAKKYCFSQYFDFAAIRTDQYRYTMHIPSGTPCEFFDLKNDPKETHNQIKNKKFNKLQKNLKNDLFKPHLQLFPLSSHLIPNPK